MAKPKIESAEEGCFRSTNAGTISKMELYRHPFHQSAIIIFERVCLILTDDQRSGAARTALPDK